MPTSVGHDWERLPPLETTRKILAEVLKIDYVPKGEYFVEAAGKKMRNGPWPADASRRAQEYMEEFMWLSRLFADKGEPRVSLWEQLADDLSKDPDFSRYVHNAARKWLRQNGELTVKDVATSFAFEGHACTVDCAQTWYNRRKDLVGKAQETWITLLKAKLGKKTPICRLTKKLDGRRQSEGELRKKEDKKSDPGQTETDVAGGDKKWKWIRQKGYQDQAVTDVTGGDQTAGAQILESPHEDKITDPAILALQKEQLQLLETAIQNLPDHLSKVVRARSDGETYMEISRRLGIPEGKARAHYAKALELLKLKLAAKEDRS